MLRSVLFAAAFVTGSARTSGAGSFMPQTVNQEVINAQHAAKHKGAVAEKHQSDLAHRASHRSITNPKIKIFYLDEANHLSDKLCMRKQMESVLQQARLVGVELTVERAPQVVFQNCYSYETCREEAPECFESDIASHWLKEDPSIALTTCTRQRVLIQALNETKDFDYFMVLRDDVIIAPHFVSSIKALVATMPKHWSLIHFDADHTVPPPEEDQVPEENRHGLPLFRVSATKQTYLDSHAFIIRSSKVMDMVSWLGNLPVVPFDFITKLPRPLHFGMWEYHPESIIPRSRANESVLLWAEDASCHGVVDPLSFAIVNDSNVIIGSSPPQSQPEQYDSRVREVLLFGMYDSGTKMLTNLLQTNLERPHGVKLCKDYAAYGYCGRVWKHTNPHRVEELKSLRNCEQCQHYPPIEEAVAVVIVRHPFGLIRSLQKHHYDMYCGGKGDTTPFTNSCKYPEPTVEWMDTDQEGQRRVPAAPCQAANMTDMCWDSLPGAWNSYVSGYQKMKNFFKKVVILRYEDVVADPETAVAEIASAVNLPMPTQVQAVKKALGQEGMGFSDHAEALRRIESLDYGAHFSCNELKVLCNSINRGALFELGYQGCQKFWPGYSELTYRSNNFKDDQAVKQLDRVPDLPLCMPDSETKVV